MQIYVFLKLIAGCSEDVYISGISYVNYQKMSSNIRSEEEHIGLLYETENVL